MRWKLHFSCPTQKMEQFRTGYPACPYHCDIASTVYKNIASIVYKNIDYMIFVILVIIEV